MCTHVCMYLCMYVCIYAFIDAHTDVCVWVHIQEGCSCEYRRCFGPSSLNSDAYGQKSSLKVLISRTFSGG